jgi:hypothetical protein
MVEASQRWVRINSQEELGGMNPALKRHLKLQIKYFKMRLEMKTGWKGF